MNEDVNVRVSGIEMNPRDPPHLSGAKLSRHLTHCFARHFAELLFALVVSRPQPLIVFFVETDGDVDEITLIRCTRAVAQPLIRAAIGQRVFSLGEEEARPRAFAFRVTVAL
jgi:hypothetical protein